MVEQHSSTNAVITGSTTHNERIERLWRDVYRCVGSLYHDCFQKLEVEGCLNPLNETDMYCLHYVFLPRINSTLEHFIESWNNHSLSSENNLTPYQLFIRGAIQQNMTPVIPSFTTAAFNSGLPSVTNHVAVPRSLFLPCPSLYSEMTRVDPLEPSLAFGSDLYKNLISLVGQHLMNGCNACET